MIETADVAIIGDGVIGLSTALELSLSGGRGHVIGVTRDGQASTAAAGLIAPSLGRLSPAVSDFYRASVERYPAFAGRLSRLDRHVHLVPWLIDVTSSATPGPHSAVTALTQAALDEREPGLVAPHGGVLHLRDFAIDNVRLMGALRREIAERAGITVTAGDAVVELSFGSSGDVTVHLESGRSIVARTVVLAAGAWAPQIRGLPRPLPVVPLKGQMLALDSRSLHHPVAGDEVYLVPRHDETVVGATVEHAGFDVSVDPAAIERMRLAAVALYRPLADARVTRSWAGIRPATPDLLPIIGRDPDFPTLIYACGHSKNGILLAPGTGWAVSRLALNLPVNIDLEPFRINRFS